MIIDNNNVKKYLDNIDKGYKIFNIQYTVEELNLIKKFNIKNYGDYNSYNTINNLVDFIKNIGNNSQNDINIMYNIIKSLLESILEIYSTDSYWIKLSIISKNTNFDIPRWHCDGFYFRNRTKLQTKFITTLKGPTTLILDTTKEEKDNYLKLREETKEPDINIDSRKYIDSKIKGIKINLTNNSGVIFVAGDKDKCLIHSEPIHNEDRIFISILPGSKEDILEYSERIENASKYSKDYKKMNEFYKAFKYPLNFIFKNEDERYKLKNIIVMMFDKNLKKEKMDIDKFKFPENIYDVYWFQEGINDEKSWKFIGKVGYKNKFKYVFYKADSDSTGFDSKGVMKLYVSKSLKRLIKQAIPKDIIKAELKEILKNVLKHP